MIIKKNTIKTLKNIIDKNCEKMLKLMKIVKIMQACRCTKTLNIKTPITSIKIQLIMNNYNT